METTYKIIGGDGREYGPIPLEELRMWVRDGRVAAATHVWRSDVGAWSPAQELLELRPEVLPAPGDSAAFDAECPGLWQRLGGLIIDLFILQFLAQVALGAAPTPDASMIGDTAAYTAFLRQASHWFANFLLLAGIYTVAFNGALAGTPGKFAVGIRIVGLAGQPVGFFRALLRFPASVFSLALFGFGYLMIAFRADRRALHDIMAGTRVIYKR